jgi:hypothetical protein
MGFLTDLFGFAVNFTVYAVLSFSSIAIVAWKIPAQTKLEKSVKYAPAHVTLTVTATEVIASMADGLWLLVSSLSISWVKFSYIVASSLSFFLGGAAGVRSLVGPFVK